MDASSSSPLPAPVPDIDDLSSLVAAVHAAERQLQLMFETNAAPVRYVDSLNTAIQALWRLTAIHKTLIRLQREIDDPSSPVAPDDPSDEIPALDIPALSAPATTSSPSSPSADSSSSSSVPSDFSPVDISSSSSSKSPAMPSVSLAPVPPVSISDCPVVPDDRRPITVARVNEAIDHLESSIARRMAQRRLWFPEDFPAAPPTPTTPPASSTPPSSLSPPLPSFFDSN